MYLWDRMRCLTALIFAIGVSHTLWAAPVCEFSPGVLNSAGSLQAQGNISNVGSVGQLGIIVSSAHSHAFGGFFHSYEIAGIADTDGDGLSDAFDVDNDNDGSTDSREIIAGTDLFDAADVLRITGIQAGPDGVSITWSSKPGHAYRVLRFDRVGAASPIAQVEVTSEPQMQSESETGQYVDREGIRSGFYAIEVMPSGQ